MASPLTLPMDATALHVIVAALCSISHNIVVLATQIHDTILTQFTIVLQKTKINHTMGLCVKAANKEH